MYSCKMKWMAIPVGILMVLAARGVHADVTICPDEAARKFQYGAKEGMQFELPKGGLPTLKDLILSYANEQKLLYSATGFADPEKAPGVEKVTHILQSRSSEVSIEINADNHSNVALAIVQTFSFHCVAAEEWKPYWRHFEKFIKNMNLKILSERPIRPTHPSHMPGVPY